MASIIKRRGADGETIYHVRIRRRGFSPACASFTKKTDASRWISETEQAIREGRYLERIEGKKNTLSEAIARYSEEFDCDVMRKTQFARWKKELGHMLLADIQPVMIYDVILISVHWNCTYLSSLYF